MTADGCDRGGIFLLLPLPSVAELLVVCLRFLSVLLSYVEGKRVGGDDDAWCVNNNKRSSSTQKSRCVMSKR